MTVGRAAGHAPGGDSALIEESLMHPSHTSQSCLRTSAWLCRWPGARRGLVFASLCVLGLTLGARAGLAHTPPAPAAVQHPRAESLTQELVVLSARHQLASPAEQAQILRNLLTMASER